MTSERAAPGGAPRADEPAAGQGLHRGESGTNASAARLMAITDIARFGVEPTLARARNLCESARPGRVLVQLRDRGLAVRTRLSVGARLRELTRRTGQQLIVNDRLDLALELGADGAHLGEGSVGARDARELLGGRAFVSRACHRLEQLDASELGPVDAVVLSPVFEARKGQPALGVGKLFEAKRRLDGLRPAPALFALGGADARRAAEVAGAGIGVAAMGAVFDGDVGELLEAMGVRS